MAWMLKLLLLAILLPCFLAQRGHNHNRYDRHREALKNEKKYPGFGAKPAKKRHIDELPKNFDWCYTDGKSYCTPSWNQHQPKYCGACYIHGTLSAVQDRLKVMRGAEGVDVNLARQVILNCGSKYGYGNGCGGGESSDIYEFMREFGLPDEGCYNYLAEAQKCPDSGEGFCVNCMMFGGDVSDYKCWPVDNYVKYHIVEYGEVSGEAAIMSELYARGPVSCGLVCPNEFVYGYKGGIFHYKGNETDVDHDVEVVGWGEEDGVPYWKVRNSWGTYWGENGFFRVVRGKNNLRIEEMCTFAIPENKEEREQARGEIYGSMFGISRPHSNDAWRWKSPNPKGPIPDIPDGQAKPSTPLRVTEAVNLNSTIPEESSSIIWQAIALIFAVSLVISCYLAFRFHKQDEYISL